MNILIIGSGGREHAFGWKIKQSPLCDQLYFAPGNGGTTDIGKNIAIDSGDFQGVKKIVKDLKIEMVVVGPEVPLVNGITDFLQADPDLENLIIIGPSKQGAMLEGSKEFAKKFMQRHHIPTARYLAITRDNKDAGKKFLTTLQPPYVLKADGLAAGKGVLIISNYTDAANELDNMLDGKFGAASKTVVIEEFLAGTELSVFILTDGNDYLVLPEAKDYKRAGEGDTGLNTGGMGAVSPVPFATPEFMFKVEERIIKPTINGLKTEGIPYRGFIFLGLIKVNNEPFVIEYNARMGDPETESVLPRLKNDLVELFISLKNGTLNRHEIITDNRVALTVVLTSGGYPGTYEKGKKITGMSPCAGSHLFHSGTNRLSGEVFTDGGRVLALTSLGPSIEEANSLVMASAARINFEGKYYRKDIGFDLIQP